VGGTVSQRVDRIVAICGSARTAEHNQLFLDSLRTALTADAAFDGGNYTEPPRKVLVAFATIYASWLASQTFFADRLYRRLGVDDLASFVEVAKALFMRHDANDLLAMAATWRGGDPSANDMYLGNFEQAMRSIEAKALVMPCDTDLYSASATTKRKLRCCATSRSHPSAPISATSPAAASTPLHSRSSTPASTRSSDPTQAVGGGR
jgi:homoserine O-acetyltransferase/O-succinyltransferase